MGTEKRDFDSGASEYDDKPIRVKLASDIAGSISGQFPVGSKFDILDFGCGTGLVAMELLAIARSITGVDSSQGMLDVFEKKIANGNLGRVKTVYADLENGDILQGQYGMVMSVMTCHHIPDLRPVFDQFNRVLLPGGYLCIADLDLESGVFHDDNTGVFHFGFDRAKLKNDFIEAGFGNVRDVDAAKVVKSGQDGQVREFSVFLMIGEKG